MSGFFKHLMGPLGMLMKGSTLQEVKAVDAALEAARVSGEAGAGLVKAIANGRGQLKGLTIDPKLLTGDKPAVVEDLVITAVNDALTQAQAMQAEKMMAASTLIMKELGMGGMGGMGGAGGGSSNFPFGPGGFPFGGGGGLTKK